MHGRLPIARLLLAAVVAIAALANARAQDADPLPPQEAYPFTLEATADRLILDFEIVDGYYLYRERFDFETATTGITLGAPVFDAGEIHEDEFFGKQEIYRHEFRIEIPYTAGAGADEVELAITLQGCADIGLCYPPQHWMRSAALPPGAAGTAANPAPQAPGGISRLLLDNGSELLAAEQAFAPNARFETANELRVTWTIAPGYYLYRDKFGFEADGDIELGEARLPEGEPHYDDNFGDVRVFYDTVEAVVPFSRARPDEMPVTIRTTFQGCKENSICYPPERLRDGDGAARRERVRFEPAANPPRSAGPASSASSLPVSEQDRLADVVLSGSWPVVLATFYGLGLLLAFTPCVLPMVPIVSGIVAGQGKVSTGRGFALSLTYVLGMAVTYTAAGALAALAGGQIQAIFQKPWIVTLFAGHIRRARPFDVRPLRAADADRDPDANGESRQSTERRHVRRNCGHRRALGAHRHDLRRAAARRDARGHRPERRCAARLGRAVRAQPRHGLAAACRRRIGRQAPAQGRCLDERGQSRFGVMMLGLAIWMMERVLPGTVTLVLWALLVFLTGVFLGAFEPLPAAPSPRSASRKGSAFSLASTERSMLIGATLGGDDPLRPLPRARLAGLSGNPGPTTEALVFEPLADVAGLEARLAAASAAGRPVLVDFTADWCVSCREMEEYTFPDPTVVAALEPFVLLRADVTANDDDDQALLKYFQSFGPPTIAFFDAHGAAAARIQARRLRPARRICRARGAPRRALDSRRRRSARRPTVATHGTVVMCADEQSHPTRRIDRRA